MSAQANHTLVVGIGASAGGLEAVSELIRHLDTRIPACFVVLQHLSPNHKSMMPEILSRETDLPVIGLQRATKPRQGTIYVVPANSNAIFKDGRIELTPAVPEVSPKPSINKFFTTLAKEMHDLAIGVVLSGTGSDGTAGLRAIQAEGGVAIVQKPDTAKYPGMPQSAIDAGCADMVLSPKDIAKHMPSIVTMHTDSNESIAENQMKQIVAMLSDSMSMDFSGYKSGTMQRRIRRRVVSSGAGRVSDYIKLLSERPDEISALASEILISVTAFFRDKDAFESFNQALLQHLQEHPEKNDLRVWVAGCATGEEAYSVAMLIAEATAGHDSPLQVQVFATDLDEEALQLARRGVYSIGALAEVPNYMIDKYFKQTSQHLEVSKKIRDMVVFARHNLVTDPPFMRVDFVTCRNVLIYFEPKLQRKVLQRFHFALAPHGMLFLGRSESITQAEELFYVVNRRDRLYGKSEQAAASVINAKVSRKAPEQTVEDIPTKDNFALLHQLLLDIRSAMVVCRRDGSVIRSMGDVARFFNEKKIGASEPSDIGAGVTNAIIKPFKDELISLMNQLDWNGSRVFGTVQVIKGEYWQLLLMPVREKSDLHLAVVILPAFLPSAKAQAEALLSSDNDHDSVLRDELNATREQLQTMLEEMATSNEEMQSLNEETQASNEELQATNEELEAANEELQATNEELISLNQELNVKTAELVALNDEYEHVYDALEFPLLVLDAQGKLLRFNAQAQRLLNLRGHSIGRDFATLKLPNYLRNDSTALFEKVFTEADTQSVMVRDGENVIQVTVTPGLNNAGDVYAVLVTLIDVSDITRAQEQLRQSQQQLSQIMSNTTIILAMKDLSGTYSYVNPRFIEAFQRDEEAVLAQTDFDVFAHDFASSVWEHDLRAVRTRQPQICEHSYSDSEGNTRIYRMVHQALTDDKGKAYALINEAEDITQRKKAEQQLQIAARVYEQAGEAIVVMDENALIQTVNSAFEKLTGRDEEQAKDTCFWSLLRLGRESEGPNNLRNTLDAEGFWQGEVTIGRGNNDTLSVWLTVNRIQAADSEKSAFVAVFADISNLKESQRKAEYLATHDSLTGLPNRTLFHDRLEHAIEIGKRNQSEVGLLFIDLDNFKTLNDTLGHDAGDDLLIQAAERLKTVARETDTVARLGGDEFTVVIADSTMAAAERIARQTLDVMSQPFIIGRRKHFMSASIGIAFFPTDGLDTTTLVKAADTAMYRAKENGRNRYEVYKEELQSQLMRHASMENALREALQKEQLYLEFQPKFSVKNPDEIIGAEALLRWKDAKLGQVSPADFIAVAEQSNLIVDVDFYVATALIRQLARWQKDGVDYPVMALNASPKSFQHESYVDLILRLLDQYQVKSLMIQLELTERTLVSQRNSELGNIERLRNAGIQLSIDDFGTGYSSMSYLKRLPLAELKIDKSFVDGLGLENNDEAISRAILAMAKALDIRTVAEGVETKQQLQWLQQEGCDYAQGYYLARPLSTEDFITRLQQGRKNEH